MSYAEFKVEQIVLEKERPSMFVLHSPRKISADTYQRIVAHWSDVWKSAGREIPPGFLILENGERLESLTDDQLVRLGLMRIPLD